MYISVVSDRLTSGAPVINDLDRLPWLPDEEAPPARTRSHKMLPLLAMAYGLLAAASYSAGTLSNGPAMSERSRESAQHGLPPPEKARPEQRKALARQLFDAYTATWPALAEPNAPY